MQANTNLAIKEQPTNGSTKRIEKLKSRFFKAKPSLCIERAVAFTRSYRETEGEIPILRRAKAFREVCQSIPVTIFDHELVVGTPGAFHRSGTLCPEISWKWLAEELETLDTRDRDPYRVTEAQKKTLQEEIFPYWQGRSVEELVLSRLPAETRQAGVDSGILDSEIKWRSAVGEVTPEFGDIILKKGFAGIRGEAEAALAELEPVDTETWEKICFYQAVIESCQGLIDLGRRYAEKALEMSRKEPDPARRAELEEIAAVCRRVPEKAPRTFWEAVQTVWFVMTGCALSENSPGFNLGRFDQYMQPFFAADLETGAISREQAQELVNCLWIKLSEWAWLLPVNGAEYYGGYNPFQNCTIGGCRKNGADAVNDMSYMCLEATSTVRLPQPALSIRISNDTPEEFLRAACRLSRLGTGFPAFHNDRVGAEMMLYAGLPPEEARDWSLLGCVVPYHSKIVEWTDAGAYNMAAAVEFALNDGKLRLTGQRIGLPTGPPSGFKTFDDFKAAVFDQLRHLIKQAALTTIVEQEVHSEVQPRPYISTLVDGSLEKGLDISRGGGRFNVGPGWVSVGVADTANSLAAVKKLVFDERKLDMETLCQALDSNFEGYEEIRQLLAGCPKFGNDDDYVDQFAVELTDFADQELRRYRDRLGLPFHNAIMGLTNNIPTGKALGALPSGRTARVPLAEGCSPHPGTDINGPTACMRSVAKVNHENQPGGTLLNIKFTPSVVAGETGLSGMAALIRGYFSLGGYHCQFNVVDTETLLDAQAHPENYQDLVVRVAGYSARFVELSREVQSEIMRRTTHLHF